MNIPEIVYKKGTAQHVASLAKLRAANSADEEHWSNRIAGYKNGIIHPQQAKPERTIIVALLHEEPVGFIAGHLTARYGCDGELQWMDVRADYRRQGIASGLVRQLAIWFIRLQAYNVCVDPGNEAARIFYARNGAVMLNDHWMYWPDIRRVVNDC